GEERAEDPAAVAGSRATRDAASTRGARVTGRFPLPFGERIRVRGPRCGESTVVAALTVMLIFTPSSGQVPSAAERNAHGSTVVKAACAAWAFGLHETSAPDTATDGTVSASNVMKGCDTSVGGGAILVSPSTRKDLGGWVGGPGSVLSKWGKKIVIV